MNSQSIHGLTSAASYTRERDLDDRHRAIHPHDEMARRVQDRDKDRSGERDPAGDRYAPSGPHQSSAGSIPIHQPVASRISGAIHSPGGLLANHGGNAPAGMGLGAGASSGPLATFGGPLQGAAELGRPIQLQGGSAPHPQMFVPMSHGQPPPGGGVFGGPLGQQQQQQQHSQEAQRGGQQGGSMGVTPGGHQIPGGITQGQQPILNDALTYLDQVKVQFHDQPDVYNRFLDIMKDFKSQAIDTPGVINRVSELFAGHPNLIQGFNTFLPPGYRIECGAGNDPNSIRVTTPMGTTVQSIAGRVAQTEGHGASVAGQPLFQDRGGQWSQRPQHSIESPEATFSTPAQNGGNLFVQVTGQGGGFDGPGVGQRGPSQMPPGLGGVPGARSAHTPIPASGSAVNGSAVNQVNMERRGPVEFNHAISYVNKIKNRFQDKPEIYKQFLEILQTYQREQKPIQDVYAQVTTLFNSAPDLLEDFKQFLPESAGQAKATPGRNDDHHAAAGSSHTPQPGVRDGQKMPPLGSFPPPASAGKDSKKRPRLDKQTAAAGPLRAETPVPNRFSQSGVNGNKRPKLSHMRGAVDAAAIEPTLTPVMPEPYPPRSSATSSVDEIAFFERVKKFLSNRIAMGEFLKLCNLFSQNIIDKNTLYYKGALFIGANPDLMTFWKTFLGVESRDVFIDNRPAPPAEKVSLSNCRGYGPSYRLLPKRERLKTCSGRDELCNSVLNDDWASHPTWASEDSGFVAHRKNQFEEGLHRIEEERHDYDFNIEANLKCIQLLEPIAQQMLAMSPAEREGFNMPSALAGQCTSIFKRICKKIYGDKALEVVNDLYAFPFDVVPVLLARMKQKDEEWRFSQREWEKVWHAQTSNMHLKSLDHMGILVKTNDKRNLTAKHLVDTIKTKWEEQRRERLIKGKAPRAQYTWDFSDKDIVLDLLRLIMLYSINNGQHSGHEKERILDFSETFIPAFFDLPEDAVQERVPKMQPDSGEEEIEDQTPSELTNGRSRRNGKKGDLLRGVLDPGRNGSKPRHQKEDSAASGSKETTPDVTSANEEELGDVAEENPVLETDNERWMHNVPRPVVIGESAPLSYGGDAEGELRADGSFQRPWHHFFCNQTMFMFFNIFRTLYQRLLEIKESKDMVIAEIERLNRSKPGRDLGLFENHMTFFEVNEDPDKFWPKTLELIEDYITGEIDENRYQDVMRHYYLRNGWKLYTIQDLLKSICRLALTATSTDAKEKTPDLIHQYLTGREKEETTYQNEISARKFADKCVKDGELFVITWHPFVAEATVRWLQKEETTFYPDEMQMKDRWQYYVSSYMRVEPTEGIPNGKLQKVLLARNVKAEQKRVTEEEHHPTPLAYDESLAISVCLKTSKMIWGPGTSEYYIFNLGPGTRKEAQKGAMRDDMTSYRREERLKRRMVHIPTWAKDMRPEEVSAQNKVFRDWLKTGVPPPSASDDVEMD